MEHGGRFNNKTVCCWLSQDWRVEVTAVGSHSSVVDTLFILSDSNLPGEVDICAWWQTVKHSG